jgi:hypothetical protein
MKIVVVAVAAASLIGGLAGEVGAEGYTKTHRHQHYAKRHYYPYAAGDHGYKQAYPDKYGWFPHDASKLAFGSALWWDQMLREGRINQGGGRN